MSDKENLIQLLKKFLCVFDKSYNKNRRVTLEYNMDVFILSKTSVIISDFSCILLDYAFLFKKPFLYVDTEINFEALDCYDIDKLPPCRYEIMEKIGKKIDIKGNDIENILAIINKLKEDEDIVSKINEACDYVWEYKGLAAERVVNFLVQTQMEMSDKC